MGGFAAPAGPAFAESHSHDRASQPTDIVNEHAVAPPLTGHREIAK